MGRPIRSAMPEWLRGPAVRHGDDYVLDLAKAEPYQPMSERNLVSDLAAVDDDDAALAFIARYGILRPRQGTKSPRQRREDFLGQAEDVRLVSRIHSALREAVAGERGALRRARELHSTIAEAFAERPRDDGRMLAQLSVFVADFVNERSAGTEQRIASAAEWEVGLDDGTPGQDAAPDVFMFAAHPRDLLGSVYHHLALLLVTRAPMGTCEGCGRFFVIEHGRQRFHDETCASRARQRRYRAQGQKTRTRTRRTRTGRNKA